MSDYGYEVMCNFCRQFHPAHLIHQCDEREMRLGKLFARLDAELATCRAIVNAKSFDELITHGDAIFAHEIGVRLD